MLERSAQRSAITLDLLWIGVMNAAAVSTLYWAQSLVVRAAAEFGPSPLVRLMPGATLAGYAVGVALLAAVARDLTSPIGLILHLVVLTAGLCAAASAPEPAIAALACVVIGLGCSLTQRLLACATTAVPPKARAETIGWIIAGGLFGIVVARAGIPFASAWLGWRAMFWTDAVIVAILGIGVMFATDRLGMLFPSTSAPSPSAATLWTRERTLRRAATQQAIVFAAFNLGWALFPRMLTQDGLATSLPMGIVASLGACAAILAGRLCTRVDPAQVAFFSMLAVLAAITLLLASGRTAHLYTVAMIVLDISTQLSLVANQARAQSLAATPPMRGRVTAMVTTIGFAGGAIGAALGNLLF